MSVPQWRVFQKEVPDPVTKSEKQIEAERQSADLLARKIEQPVELKPVAQTLSESLGRPENPIEGEDIGKTSREATKAVSVAVRDYQERRDEQDDWLRRYAGLDIENTGVNLFGGSVVLSLGAVVALMVLVPGFGSLVIFMIRRIYASGKEVVEGIEVFKQAEPDKAAELEEWLSSYMNRKAKNDVAKMREHLSKHAKSNIEEIRLSNK